MEIILYIALPVIGLIVAILCFIIIPLMKKSSYSSKEDTIQVGMTEDELYTKCGTPSKTVVIDNDHKLVSYTFDEWKGILFGGSKHHEITATIKNGKVTNISTSD